MEMQWMGLALITAIAGAACAMASAVIVRRMRRALTNQQQESDRQLRAMNATVEALQARVAELEALPMQQSAPGAGGVDRKTEALEPETVAVLAAATTTYVGREVRVRSAQALPSQNSAGNWAQQGRTSVQTSHNPRSRR